MTGEGVGRCVPPTAYESCRGLFRPFFISVFELFFDILHMHNRRVTVPRVDAGAGGDILAPAVVFPRGVPSLPKFVLSDGRQYVQGVGVGGPLHSLFPFASPMC